MKRVLAMFLRHGLARLAAAILAATSTGCVKVAPYERAKLADPTMVPSDIVGYGEGHVRAIHEGATGGHGATGAGCGCN
jgi:hypothetical protein